MATPVEMPKLGNTVEECLIAKWRRQKGDVVSPGDIVVEIETDKATFEVPAPVGGTLLATFFDEGALVPVYTNIFAIGEPGESIEAFRPGSEARAEAATPIVAPEQPAPRVERSPAPLATSAPFSPRARRFVAEHDFHPAAVAGSGPGGRVLEQDLRELYFSSPRLSEAARMRVASGDLAPAHGSGAGGMILASDVGPAAAKLSGIREKIARRMRESLASTAQYTLNSSANAAGLLILRARFKASAGAADVNINDLVMFCTVKALLDMPELNAHLIDGAIRRRHKVHLGFACDTPRGLIVPVIRSAERMSVAELSARARELADRAVQGSISPDDLTGATFTISNLGALGIESFTPVLNPPQVAILGVNAIQLKPVRRDGRVEFIDAIGFSLTCDHQVIDGAPGARFLNVLKNKIENVESLCTI
jgi:pyruvate dehydrogenase E2 component (dihydrolipoamide acetyltransferase)